MYCSNCGYQNENTASICQSCEERLTNQVSSQTSDDPSSFHSWSDRNKFDIFIGRNQDYYFQQWKYNGGKLNKWGVNWIALFFGVIWFGYRKMYIWMFGIFIIELLLLIIFLIAMFEGFNTVFLLSLLSIPLLRLLLAIFGNKMYFHHVQEKVSKIELQQTTTDGFINTLKYKGNTSGLGSLFAFILSTALYFVVFITFLVFVASALYD